MKFTISCGIVLAWGMVALVAPAQQTTVQIQGTGTQIRGQVISASNGQFVVRGPNNKEITFYANPQTRYFANNQAAKFEAIRVGSTLNVWYGEPVENKIYVNTVAVLPADTAAPNPQAEVYEGEIVRIVGKDQVVIRTKDGKEIIVYVEPKTTYRFDDQPAQFNQFQVGVPVRVDYYLRDSRPYARGILGRRNK